ncbi:MAG: transcription termination/antitermination protein NusA [Helicobacteraceae bacterium]|nr:transcription termination/antitermination protein NusA [Helicobacteraceae bacterium]
MEKILDIIDSIAHEKGLKQEDVQGAIKTAFVQTAKRVIDDELAFSAVIDESNKTLTLIQTITVVADDDAKLSGEEKGAYMSLSEALENDPDAEIEDAFQVEHNLEDYGRTGAQQLHREIEYHVQRLVENSIYDKYKSKIGTIVSGRVTRVDHEQSTYIEVDEVKAILPMKSRIKGEIFKVGDILKAVVRRVNIDKLAGISIEISRTSPKFLEELLRLEVPEIADEIVTIERSARIPGDRAKIALMSSHPQVDPIGATVGVRGVRINAVSEELLNENIDCIEFTNIPELFIARVMSPAIISSVSIEGEKAIVILPSDQKSKAIGKSGINIRLASMLSGFEIELKDIPSSGDGSSSETEEKKDDLSSLEALFN